MSGRQRASSIATVAAREAIKSGRGGAPTPASDGAQLAALRGIEAKLEEIAGLLRERR